MVPLTVDVPTNAVFLDHLEREGRFARELVITWTYFIGNYTYNTEHVFRLDGGIDVREGAAGTTLNRCVSSAAEGTAFATLVAPNIAAPLHQHSFSFRIDFDVDGKGAVRGAPLGTLARCWVGRGPAAEGCRDPSAACQPQRRSEL